MMNFSTEDSHNVHAQIGADRLIPRLSAIQEEDEEVTCNPGNKYTLQLLIDAISQIHPSPNEDVVTEVDLSCFAGGRDEFESLNRPTPVPFAGSEDDSGVVRMIPICS